MAHLSNCLFAAWKIFWNGGYLIIRRSRVGFFPHFMAQDIHGRLWNFEPVEDKIKTDAYGMPPLAFIGEYRGNDWANHCHCLLRALGRPDNELRRLSDSDVVMEFEALRARINGDW